MSKPDIVELAGKLPYAPPPPERVEEMRTSVLTSMALREKPRPARARWLAAGAACAACIVAAVLFRETRHDPRQPTWHAHVMPLGPVEYARASSVPDEVVRLRDGILALDVTPLAPGERCRVVIGDAEVEVRGTSFVVEARADHLVAVGVHHGRVEVRAQGRSVFLGAGEHWPKAPVVTFQPVVEAPAVAVTSGTPSLVTTPTPRAAPQPAHPSKSPVRAELSQRESTGSAATASDPGGRAFREGWDAFRAGDSSAAVTAFDASLRLAPHGPVAEDAAFWRAAAYAKAGRHAAAIGAFTSFLVDHPASVRASEARVLLGWEHLATGDLARAKEAFDQAATDGVASIQARARDGIAEVQKRSNASD